MLVHLKSKHSCLNLNRVLQVVFILLPLLVTHLAEAAPVLSKFQDIEGVRLYNDHEKSTLFYIGSAAPTLNQSNSPGYSLDVFRYVGTKATGDQGDFRVRGVLSLSFDRKQDPMVIGKIKRQLRSQNISRPMLKSIPVSATTVRLIHGGMEKRFEYGSRWTPKEVRLPLDEVMAELLWKAVEAGQTQVSLVIEEVIKGVEEKDGEWLEIAGAKVHTFPVVMDMEKYPSSFIQIDLGGRQQRGYTGVDIFCYDFLEQFDENLYAKKVELAITTPGKPLVEIVEFNERSDYRARVDFKLSREIDAPYRYRITKIFIDGNKKTGPWLDKVGDRLLDITDYRDETESEEDDQMAEEMKEE